MTQTTRRLSRAKDFMVDAHSEPIGLSEIADKANLSPYHFLRLYKQTFGETPHHYLSRVRLERAKTLLKTSDLSVSEVCLEVGFESLSSFSAWFLREVGLPPSHYRKHARSLVYIPSIYRTVFVPSCYVLMLSGAQD